MKWEEIDQNLSALMKNPTGPIPDDWVIRFDDPDQSEERAPQRRAAIIIWPIAALVLFCAAGLVTKLWSDATNLRRETVEKGRLSSRLARAEIDRAALQSKLDESSRETTRLRQFIASKAPDAWPPAKLDLTGKFSRINQDPKDGFKVTADVKMSMTLLSSGDFTGHILTDGEGIIITYMVHASMDGDPDTPTLKVTFETMLITVNNRVPGQLRIDDGSAIIHQTLFGLFAIPEKPGTHAVLTLKLDRRSHTYESIANDIRVQGSFTINPPQ